MEKKESIKSLESAGFEVLNDQYYFLAYKEKDGSTRFVINNIKNDNIKIGDMDFERIDIVNDGEKAHIQYQTTVKFLPPFHSFLLNKEKEEGKGWNIDFEDESEFENIDDEIDSVLDLIADVVSSEELFVIEQKLKQKYGVK